MTCWSNGFCYKKTTSLLLIAMTAACSTAPKHDDVYARIQKDFEAVRQSPSVAFNAPIALGEAEQALALAQAATQDGDDAAAAHGWYMAAKRLEIAKLAASARLADQRYQALARDREDLIFALNDRDLAKERKAKDAAMRSAERLQQALSEFRVERTARGLMVTLGEVVFETNKSDLKPGIARRLEPLAQFLRTYADRAVDVEGHTDHVGDESYNLQLSQKRAETVRQFLLDAGVAGQRVKATGLGESLPIDSNDSAAGRQRNRRVEIVIKDTQ
jgi:OmpA-OmpF porin, OOP family